MEKLNTSRALATADPRDGEIVFVRGVFGQERFQLIVAEAAPIVFARHCHVLLSAEEIFPNKFNLDRDTHILHRAVDVFSYEKGIDCVGDQLFENDIWIVAEFRVLYAAPDIECHFLFQVPMEEEASIFANALKIATRLLAPSMRLSQPRNYTQVA
jgi:hypothetical protein